MENDRYINSIHRNLDAGNILTSGNIQALIDAYQYGTATPMIALIKTLCKMKQLTFEGKIIKYTIDSYTINEIDKNNFQEFVILYFDEFIYKEVTLNNTSKKYM